jgi:hypothetical protein
MFKFLSDLRAQEFQFKGTRSCSYSSGTKMYILFYILGSYPDLHEQGGKSISGMFFPFGGTMLKLFLGVPMISCVVLDHFPCLPASSTIKTGDFWLLLQVENVHLQIQSFNFFLLFLLMDFFSFYMHAR